MFGAIALGTSLYSAFKQNQGAQDLAANAAAQAQLTRQQLELQKQQSEVENIRKVRAQVRQARLTRSAIVQSAANTGTSLSTGAIGAAGSVGTKLAGELDYFGGTAERQAKGLDLQVESGNLSARAGQIQGDMAQWGAIGGLAGTIFSEGFGGYKELFK